MKSLLCLSLAVLLQTMPVGAQAEECASLDGCSKIDVSTVTESFDTEIFVSGGGGKARSLGGPSGSCPGCTYILLPSCPQNGVSTEDSGLVLVEDGVLCGGAVYPCPDPADTRFFVFRQRPGEPYTRVDFVCLGPGVQPISRGQLEAAAARHLGSLRPAAARIEAQPPTGAVTGLAAVFHAGDQPAISGTVDTGRTAGIVVTVTARPASWKWIFEGDAANPVYATAPGGPYPDHAAAHTYRRVSDRETVTLVTTWTAAYTIGGIAGEQPVPGPGVRVTSSRDIVVREARATLYAGD